MNYLTLYIIDNYLLSRIIYKKQLEKNKKIKILNVFSNIKECIENMEKKQADLILMNITNEKINGKRITEFFKEKYPKTKIIAFVINNDKQTILSALSDGVSGFILKENNNIKKAINIIIHDGFWMDLEIANFIFPKLANSKKIHNEKEHNNLKNILTKRELEVLKLLIEGKTNSQIATEIIVSTNTAKAHVGSILTKLNVKDRVQAAVKAVRINLV